jgi:hypothetical protein
MIFLICSWIQFALFYWAFLHPRSLADWPIVLLLGGFFTWIGAECNTGFIEELGGIPSLSISWRSLRKVRMSSLKA